MPALENVALWHERDISHSSVERVLIPDATIALHYQLHLLDQVLTQLGVHPERMKQNLLRLGSAVFSQRLLLALADKIGSRDKSYTVVQRLALSAGDDSTFEERVRRDPLVRSHLTAKQLDEIFDVRYFLRRSRTILKRALAQK
jgi:adenylosuccinate lyase